LQKRCGRLISEEQIVNEAYDETQFLDDEGHDEHIDVADLVPLPRNTESVFSKD
jgi:hypothetical protein